MIRVEGLHQHPAALVAPARAAGHLRDQVEGPLGGTEVGQVQRGVGIDHADQGHIGEVQSLGDHLRAQQDLHLAAAEGVQGLLVAAGALHGVAVHPQYADAGEAGADLGLQPLRAQAAVVDAPEAALGTLGWGRHLVVAVVAEGDLLRAVVRQRDVAMGTLDHGPAGRALDVGGETAAVQQQDHLAALAQRLVHRRVQVAADRAARAARVLVVSQVDGAHRRHRAAEHAAGHRHQSIAARHGPLPALQRGRGRAQHQRHLLDFAAGQGHVAGVVARRGLLLESRLVLLIQDHQAQVRHRGEDRTASAHDHLHLAVGNPLPLPMPFGVA